MFSISVDFAPVGKPVFVFHEPCPPRANAISFLKALARLGQARFHFIPLLPALGKPFIFLHREFDTIPYHRVVRPRS